MAYLDSMAPPLADGLAKGSITIPLGLAKARNTQTVAKNIPAPARLTSYDPINLALLREWTNAPLSVWQQFKTLENYITWRRGYR